MENENKIPVRHLRVSDVMTETVHAVNPSMTLREVVELFLTKGISGAPIVDFSGKVISVISQTDLIQFIAVDGMIRTVKEYMARLPKESEVISVRRADQFKDVFKEFLTKPVRRIIVIDNNGKLQGVVSKSNLLKAFLGAET